MRRPFVLALASATLLGVAGVAWRSDTRDSSWPATAAVDGAALFHLKGCARCHDRAGWTADVGVGPALVDVATWAGRRRPGLDAAAYLEESIRDPAAYDAAGGPYEMPTLVLTDDEIDRLVRYLLTG